MPLRIRRAAAAGIGLWMLTGLVLFSHMERLHPRYVEGFTPAVAALLGIGLAWATAPRGRLRLAALAVAMLVTVYYAERLLYGTEAVWAIVLAGALAALAAALLARRARSDRARGLLGAATLAAALVAVLAVGVKTDVRAIRDKISAAGFVGQIPGDVQRKLSSYLHAHNRGARYELAARVSDLDRLADRAGREADRRPHDLQRARLHAGRQAEADDRRRAGALRLPQHDVREESILGERGLLGPGAVDPRERHRRLERGGAARTGRLVAVAGGEAVSGGASGRGRDRGARRAGGRRAPASSSSAPARPGGSRSTRSSWARAATGRSCA